MRLVSTKKAAGQKGGADAGGPRVTSSAVTPRYLKVAEVAELLRCRPSTIYQLVHKRRIPFRKAGRQLLFEVSEIDSWTKSGADNQ